VLASISGLGSSAAPGASGAEVHAEPAQDGQQRAWQRVAVQAASASGQAYRCAVQAVQSGFTEGEHTCSVAAHLASGARLKLRAPCRRAGDLLSRGLLRGCQPRPAEGPADGLEATGVATNVDGEPLSAVVRPAHTSQEPAACACLARLHHAHVASAARHRWTGVQLEVGDVRLV